MSYYMLFYLVLPCLCCFLASFRFFIGLPVLSLVSHGKIIHSFLRVTPRVKNLAPTKFFSPRGNSKLLWGIFVSFSGRYFLSPLYRRTRAWRGRELRKEGVQVYGRITARMRPPLKVVRRNTGEILLTLYPFLAKRFCSNIKRIPNSSFFFPA